MTTAHDVNSVFLYAATAVGAWIGENWSTIAFVVFGAVHAYIALDNWRYKRSMRGVQNG